MHDASTDNMFFRNTITGKTQRKKPVGLRVGDY